MAGLTKRKVVLRGEPIFYEGGKATAQVNPGYLVKGYSFVAHQSAGAAVPVQKVFAVEREELGTGIDATYATTGSGTGNYYYASGDQVKVAACHAGMQITAFIGSGVSCTEDTTVFESAGDGTLKALDVYSSGTGPAYPLARALETLSASATAQAVRVEIL